MKKTDNRIIKKKGLDEDLFGYDDSIATPEQEILGRPVPGPEPKPKPKPIPPVPPKPEPTKPTPVKDITFGDGLSVNEKVVKVKSDKRNKDYMTVSLDGVCIEPLIRKIEHLERIVYNLNNRLTDAESDINMLKGKTKTSSITKTIVGQSKSFEVDEEGKIIIKTDSGIKTDDDGNIVVNGDESLTIRDNGTVGVDYDEETMGLIDMEDGNKKLTTVYNSFEIDIQEDNKE